jgi:Sigma-70, region 4
VNRAGLARRGSGKIEDLNITMSSRFLADPDQARVANGSCSEENDIGEAVRRAFGRASSWRTPPHWSRCDWLDEVRAILRFGAVSAVFSYDKERGVPLIAHIYIRAVAAARAHYRQEWSYYLHAVPESGKRAEPIATSSAEANGEESRDHLLGPALNHLSIRDQLLIHRLFWDNADQRRVAAKLQISQQCVSRRKTRVLRQLRRLLSTQSQLFSHTLAACWALLDSLNLLPAINFLW